MKNQALTHQHWLSSELQSRRRKNKRYSLRAMARLLSLHPGRLSEYLSGRRRMGVKVAERIATRLAFSPRKRKAFLNSVKAVGDAPNDYLLLEEEKFHVIADWYHFAILSLMELDEFQGTPEWMARRLGISVFVAKAALVRLQRVELVGKSKAGYFKTGGSLTTTHDVESAALRYAHRQTLEEAVQTLENVPVELRDITSITMAIDPAKLPDAKEVIKKFRRDLCEFLESGAKKEVFNLNIQLYPLTLSQKKKEEK